MAIRRVRIDLIDDDLEPEAVGLGKQRVEVGQAAEERIDVAIVGHVVAEVLHRRGEERRQPDPVDAEAGDVVEAAGNARQIADAVAVRIAKAARVDLIDHRAAPPLAHAVLSFVRYAAERPVSSVSGRPCRPNRVANGKAGRCSAPAPLLLFQPGHVRAVQLRPRRRRHAVEQNAEKDRGDDRREQIAGAGHVAGLDDRAADRGSMPDPRGPNQPRKITVEG